MRSSSARASRRSSERTSPRTSGRSTTGLERLVPLCSGGRDGAHASLVTESAGWSREEFSGSREELRGGSESRGVSGPSEHGGGDNVCSPSLVDGVQVGAPDTASVATSELLARLFCLRAESLSEALLAARAEEGSTPLGRCGSCNTSSGCRASQLQATAASRRSTRLSSLQDETSSADSPARGSAGSPRRSCAESPRRGRASLRGSSSLGFLETSMPEEAPGGSVAGQRGVCFVGVPGVNQPAGCCAGGAPLAARASFATESGTEQQAPTPPGPLSAGGSPELQSRSVLGLFSRGSSTDPHSCGSLGLCSWGSTVERQQSSGSSAGGARLSEPSTKRVRRPSTARVRVEEPSLVSAHL